MDSTADNAGSRAAAGAPGPFGRSSPQIPAVVEVAPGILLDARLALIHRSSGWMAIADVHYAHEISQRVAGGLGPLWGMDDIRVRLQGLVADYRPQTLIFCGDTVHNRAGWPAAMEFFEWIRGLCPGVVLIAGNHDRRLLPAADAVESHGIGSFLFTHGDRDCDTPDGVVRIEGHWHPAVRLKDGAGLNLRLPAFVMGPRRWVLPAFSPWAGGAAWLENELGTHTFAISPGRILKLQG